MNKSNGMEETLGDCDTGNSIQLETEELVEKLGSSNTEAEIERDKVEKSEKGGGDKFINDDYDNIVRNNHAGSGSVNNRGGGHSAALSHVLSSSNSIKHAAASVATPISTPTVATHTTHTATVATPVTLLSPSRASTRSLRGFPLSVCETEEGSQISIPSVTKNRGKRFLRSTYLTSLPLFIVIIWSCAHLCNTFG